MEARRTTLVVLFGGQSAEHDVSCVSAAHVIDAADPAEFDVVAVGIARDGSWHRSPSHTFRGTAQRGPVGTLAVSGPVVEPTSVLSSEEGTVVVVPLLHGPLGEDGTVQGMLELLDVAYVGAGVLSSALAMDKAVAKQVLAQAGIPQARHTVLHADECTEPAVGAAFAGLGGDVFVKPANMGSSVGVSHAVTIDETIAAVTLAGKYDNWIVIEETVHGREIEVSVIGNRDPRASLPGEITPAKDFYDYADKYEDGAATLTIPAALDEERTSEIRELAVRAYRALRCEGMARVDFFLEENGRGFLVNEINTIPGFTPISMYPKMWEASGLPYRDLVSELVRLAQERHSTRKRNTAR